MNFDEHKLTDGRDGQGDRCSVRVLRSPNQMPFKQNVWQCPPFSLDLFTNPKEGKSEGGRSGKEFVLICHAARGSSVPYRIYIVYRTVSGVETTVSLRSRASCRTQFQFQLACKCGYQSQVVEPERGEAAQKGAQKMAQNGSQQQGQQQQQQKLRCCCCNNKGQNYKAKKYLQPHHYCCCCRCSCCCICCCCCSSCCCSCSCCSCSFPCCCCCCSTIVWLLGSARTFCKRRTLFPFAVFRSHHTQLSCPARHCLSSPSLSPALQCFVRLCPAHHTAGNCLTNAASFAPSLWFELPPRCLLIIWQMSWGPKQQQQQQQQASSPFWQKEEVKRGRRGSSCLWWIQRACQMHWPQVAFAFVCVFLLTVFDSLLALFCFVIYLTIICAACPQFLLPLLSPLLSCHALNFLNNEHYVEKQEKLLFCSLQRFSFAASHLACRASHMRNEFQLALFIRNAINSL